MCRRFWGKIFSKQDAKHLLNALQDKYEITIDEEGKNYCGLNIDWNYKKGYVDISMPNYVIKTLHKLNHKFPIKDEYAPHEWNKPVYGKSFQQAVEEDQAEKLDEKGKLRVQKIVGSFLYYARAIDNTILPALNEIVANQETPTTNTNKKLTRLLNYMATYPNAKIRFFRSNMILHTDSDAAYLVAPKAKSRIAGYYFLSDKTHNVLLLPLILSSLIFSVHFLLV